MIKKSLALFTAFAVIHIGAWIGADRYLNASPPTVLVVVDTSYSMKPHFSAMADWIESQGDDARYQKIIVGTDKANLGDLSKLRSTSVIFRTAFGRLSTDALKKYENVSANRRVLLSDGSTTPGGWDVVEFK